MLCVIGQALNEQEGPAAMSQVWIPARFYRGGTSKGVFFHGRDLPADREACSQLLLAVLGSPDANGRQLDGMGGGISSLSKAVIIGPSSRADADVDYTFVQLAVDKPVADWTSNCGNLTSAVGPFAVDEGVVRVRDGEALVRIHQTNTRKVIHARFPVEGGRARVDGDFAIAGVAGTGARIRLDFLDPGGAGTGRLLPTGNAVDRIEVPDAGTFDVSVVDATTVVAYVKAEDVGLEGTETPEEIEVRPAVMALLDRIRRRVGVVIGLADRAEKVPLQSPRIAVVSRPARFKSLDGTVHEAGSHDLATRMLSMERAHRAIMGTGALNIGVASRIEGTIPHALTRRTGPPDETRVGNPSGLVSVGAEVRRAGNGWAVDSAVLFRTARRLMQGEVAVPMRLAGLAKDRAREGAATA
jgi:2-methylaconitate cis-trans-isomerase PrpF